MRPVALTHTILFAAGFGLAAGVPAMAAPIVASDDVFVNIGDVVGAGSTTAANNGTTTQSSDDNRSSETSNADNVSLFRFEVPTATGTSSGSSLTLSVRSAAATNATPATALIGPFTLRLYGAIEGSAEDNLQEGTYAGADAQAVDASPNRVQEPFVFGTSPLDTVSLAALPLGDDNGGNAQVVFDGATFDSFISSVTTNPSDSDLGFLVILEHDNDELVLVNFHSRNYNTTTYGDDEAPTLNIVPEPASLALLGLGGLAMLGRPRRRA
jgi:hypothetical protein